LIFFIFVMLQTSNCIAYERAIQEKN